MKRLENNENGGKAKNRLLDDGKVGKRATMESEREGEAGVGRWSAGRKMKWEQAFEEGAGRLSGGWNMKWGQEYEVGAGLWNGSMTISVSRILKREQDFE